ncbi:MAG: carbohydrate ABC transporter permease [Nitrososphaerota archaeon]
MKKYFLRVLLYLSLISFAFYYLMPLYVLVTTSFKSFAEVNLYRMWDLPKRLSLESFHRALFGGGGGPALAPNFLNSLRMVIPAALLSGFLGSINGYLLAQWRFKGANLLFTLLLFGMFIPYQSILIPLVQTLRWLGLYGSTLGLIFTHTIYGIPITTLIFRNYYATIPAELVEAARLDGASVLGVYRRIIFPLSLPGFAVALIWQFTSIWNDFLFAVTVAQNPATQPVTVALNNMAGSYFVEWNVQIAGALLTATPTLLVYVLLGRYFMRGLLAGSLKG